MTNSINYQFLFDTIDTGHIVLNKDFKILYMNKSSKLMLGLVNYSEEPHPKGTLEKGDIVIFVTSALGEDDGNMTPSDLKELGIDEEQIQPKDIILSIFRFGSKEKPYYKAFRYNAFKHYYSIESTIDGHDFFAYLDEIKGYVGASVDGKKYSLEYINSIGYILIYSTKSKCIKFYQDIGYSMRDESPKEILQQNPYIAKGDMENVSDFPEINFFDLGKDTDFSFFETFTTSENNQQNYVYAEFNKRPFIISSKSIVDESGEKIYLLQLENISHLSNEKEKYLLMKTKIDEYQQERSTKYYPDLSSSFKTFVGSSESINKVKFFAFKASESMENVLITGESGTGKSKLAKQIHQLQNPKKPFITVNCSSIPRELFESELFGYEKGSFTGALTTGKKGYFELAENGTLFLDEIGELPFDIQAKLLHAIQNKEFYKIGASEPTRVNTRIISATNINLLEEVESGNFRQDLYYRLNVFPIEIPPLRERLLDLKLLIEEILTLTCKEYQVPPKILSENAMGKLMSYSWPGNVRELENTLKRAVILCDTKIIYSEYLEIPSAPEILDLATHLDAEEKKYLQQILELTNNNRKEMMELLNVSKSSLYNKLTKYEL